MGVLDNIRVVDFGHHVAGPVVGMLLADQGANVVKIDRPDATCGPGSPATWNRGKRRIALDLHDRHDHAVALTLARRADVVIENFRPGVMDRLGLGEAALRPHNPGLIYNAMPAFGRRDPRSAMPGWEGAVLAAVDAFRPPPTPEAPLGQLHRRPVEREDPAFSPTPMASFQAALLSATVIGAALHIRQRTGSGQRVEVPLFDAMIQAIGVHASAELPYRPPGQPTMSPWDQRYRCADGRWLQIVCSSEIHAQHLAELAGRPDLIERGLTGPEHRRWGGHHELIAILTETFAARPAPEWEKLLIEHELPGALCRSPAEWLDHPQAVDGDLLIGVEDPDLGPTRQPAPVVQLHGASTAPPTSAARPDADRLSILTELTSDRPSPRHRPSSLIPPTTGPLVGLRVIDLGTSVAGPTCGRILADLGADVIKIDSPHRRVANHHDVNRGKRSILLDLETDDGHAVFVDLLQRADVVVENFRPGVVEDLGVDDQRCREIKPEIIYATVTAHGQAGPLAELPGFDQSVQALTGIQVGQGGSDHPAPWSYPHVGTHAAGQAAAFGVILAVLHRDRTGEGLSVTTDLARTAGLLQSDELIDHRARSWSEATPGSGGPGSDPLNRLYRCADGWIHVGGRDPAAIEADLAGTGGGDLGQRLARFCLSRSVDDAVGLLIERGLGAQALTWLQDVMTDPAVVGQGLSLVGDRGPLGLVRTTGPGRWLSHSMIDPGAPAPEPGADAASVLADVGRQDDLEALVRAGAVAYPGASGRGHGANVAEAVDPAESGEGQHADDDDGQGPEATEDDGRHQPEPGRGEA